MPIEITNETHWRTPDIERLIRGAMKAGCADPQRRYKVEVVYNVKKTRSRKTKTTRTVALSNPVVGFVRQARHIQITIKLPKVGPRDLHPTAMLAIAAAAAAPTDGDLLAPSVSYWVANELTFRFWDKARSSGTYTYERHAEIVSFYCSDMPPFWSKAGDALICKVKDPLKDGTYLDFVKKKTAALKRAETAIEKEIANIESAKRRLKKARQRKKDIERSLKGAKERRA